MLSSFKIFLDLSNTLPSEQIIESLIKILYHTQKDNAEIIIDCLIQYNALNNNNNNYNNDNNNINNNNVSRITNCIKKKKIRIYIFQNKN